MDVVFIPAGGLGSPRALLQALLATVRHYWRQAEPYQKFAYVIGLLLIGSAVFHTGVLLATGGSLEGPISWRKPILFGEAFGITAISVSWVMTFLPKRRLIGWLLMGALGLANLEEVVWVSVQQWRGVPSHFNSSTPFDEAAFITNGFVIGFTVTVVTVVALWSFFSLKGPRSLSWAIWAGMGLLVVSQMVGILMIFNGIARETIADAAVFGAAGAMKLPHALGLHAIQVLPVLALMLRFADWPEGRRARVVLAGTVGYIGVVVVSMWQTFNGLAPFELALAPASALAISAGLLVAAYALALIAIRGTLGQSRGGSGTS